MSEIKTAPVLTHDANGDEVWSFHAHHTIADIARWIGRNRGEAEDLITILQAQLNRTEGAVMQ